MFLKQSLYDTRFFVFFLIALLWFKLQLQQSRFNNIWIKRLNLFSDYVTFFQSFEGLNKRNKNIGVFCLIILTTILFISCSV